jgi:hypothetical protein
MRNLVTMHGTNNVKSAQKSQFRLRVELLVQLHTQKFNGFKYISAR